MVSSAVKWCRVRLKDFSHPSFIEEVIVQSYWAFELVRSNFIFIAQRTFKDNTLYRWPIRFFQITHS